MRTASQTLSEHRRSLDARRDDLDERQAFLNQFDAANNELHYEGPTQTELNQEARALEAEEDAHQNIADAAQGFSGRVNVVLECSAGNVAGFVEDTSGDELSMVLAHAGNRTEVNNTFVHERTHLDSQKDYSDLYIPTAIHVACMNTYGCDAWDALNEMTTQDRTVDLTGRWGNCAYNPWVVRLRETHSVSREIDPLDRTITDLHMDTQVQERDVLTLLAATLEVCTGKELVDKLAS